LGNRGLDWLFFLGRGLFSWRLGWPDDHLLLLRRRRHDWLDWRWWSGLLSWLWDHRRGDDFFDFDGTEAHSVEIETAVSENREQDKRRQ
jgi:hypothetical protein